VAKTTSVPRPLKKAEYEIVFATRDAQSGWTDLRATTANTLADAWDALTHDPKDVSPKCHPLKGDLATVTHAGSTHERWQYELPGGARIWYYVTEGGKTAGTVHLIKMHTHHPNETK